MGDLIDNEGLLVEVTAFIDDLHDELGVHELSDLPTNNKEYSILVLNIRRFPDFIIWHELLFFHD